MIFLDDKNSTVPSQYDVKPVEHLLHPLFDIGKKPYMVIPNKNDDLLKFMEELANKISKSSGLYYDTEISDREYCLLLAAIANFDIQKCHKMMERRKRFSRSFQTTSGTCKYCDRARSDLLIMSECKTISSGPEKHSGCCECLKKKFEEDIKKGELPSCVNPTCKILPGKLFLKQVGLSIPNIAIERIKNSNTTRICCNQIYFLPFNYSKYVTNAKCLQCKKVFCFRCFRPNHLPVACHWNEDFHLLIQNLLPVSSLVNYRTMEYQDCINTKCSVVSIWRKGNSNEMSCSRCRSRWCFKCGYQFHPGSTTWDHDCGVVREERPYTNTKRVREEKKKNLEAIATSNPKFLRAFLKFVHYSEIKNRVYDMSIQDEVKRSSDYETKIGFLRSIHYCANFVRNLAILNYYLESSNPTHLRESGYRRPTEPNLKSMMEMNEEKLENELNSYNRKLEFEEYPRTNQDAEKMVNLVKPIYDTIKENYLEIPEWVPPKPLGFESLGDPIKDEYFLEGSSYEECFHSMKRVGWKKFYRDLRPVSRPYQQQSNSGFPPFPPVNQSIMKNSKKKGPGSGFLFPPLPPKPPGKSKSLGGGNSYESDLELAMALSRSEHDKTMMQKAIEASMKESHSPTSLGPVVPVRVIPPPPLPIGEEEEEEIEGEVEKEKDQIVGSKRKVDQIKQEDEVEEKKDEEKLEPPEKKRKIDDGKK